MWIDTENNQDFLALLHALQQNKSNAVSTAKIRASRLEKRKVHIVAHDLNQVKAIYSLEPIKDLPHDPHPQEIKSPGRPKILTDSDKKFINNNLQTMSMRAIAKHLHVDPKTIRNYIRNQ